jgi:hypothetical protein
VLPHHQSECTVTEYYYGDQIKENELDRLCSMHGRNKKYMQTLSENLNGRDNLGDPGVDGRINVREI